jgi:phage/plasmid primase-like uncharacterized protein
MNFVQFSQANGVLINDLMPSDRIHRCGTVEHPRSKNGAYFWDGERGWCQAWDTGAAVNWFGDSREWTDAEKRAWGERRQAARKEEESRWAKASRTAASMLASAKPQEHNYLHRKGLHHAHGLVLPDGALMVPMRDATTNDLRGAQVIRWDEASMAWEKKMLPGMRAKGAVLRLGRKQAALTVFCEGYATGLSIEVAVRQMRMDASVLICFSAANLVHVASQGKPRGIVFADNDRTGTGESAARETALPYCMSDQMGEDANDVHIRAGVVAVCALLMKARSEVP